MRKSALLYKFILSCWLILLAATAPAFWHEVDLSTRHGTLVAVLVGLSTIFIAYFWLNGMKDLVYTLYYYRNRRRFRLPPSGHFRKLNGRVAKWRVAMVYCTYNDFNAESLEACMRQDYPRHAFVI